MTQAMQVQLLLLSVGSVSPLCSLYIWKLFVANDTHVKLK